MHILIIHQYFLGKEDGGGSRFNEFSKYWSSSGNKITVIAGMVNYTTGLKAEDYKGRFMVKEKLDHNITIIRTHVSEKYNSSFLGRLWGYFSFTFSSSIAAIFKVEKPDIVIVTSPPLFVGITGYIIKLLKNIPLVFEVRDLWPESAIDTGVLNNKLLIKLSFWFERFIYKNANLVNVLTPSFKDKLIKEKGVNLDKVVMIPNGADTDIVYPSLKHNWVREQYKLQNKFVILYMGAHGIANNLITLVEAANELKQYEDIVIMLVGDGMQKKAIQTKSLELGLINIIFVDSQPKSKINDFCNAADVCTAVLKKVDTFKTVYPNKVFDYMSCAKPIIIGIDGIAKELVEDSRSGIYSEPENALAFKAAVLKLYNDNELCDQMGKNGYEYVIENFNRKNLAFKYEEYLKQVINR